VLTKADEINIIEVVCLHEELQNMQPGTPCLRVPRIHAKWCLCLSLDSYHCWCLMVITAVTKPET